MIRFITTSSKPNYSTELRTAFSEHEPTELLKIAVAFWGKDAERLLKTAVLKVGADRCQFICNLESNATNPDLIQALLDLDVGVVVKTNPTLHAKVILTSKVCITGSANLSANGLGIEEGAAYWQEAGILTNDPSARADVNKWFDALYGDRLTHVINNDDIARARKRRAANPPPTTPWHLTSPMQALESWLDRKNIWLTLWDEQKHKASESASDENDAMRSSTGLTNLDFYENWPELQAEDRLILDLAFDNGKVAISYWKRHHSVEQSETLCFVLPASQAECPESQRNAWKTLLTNKKVIRNLATFASATSEGQMISTSAELRELLEQSDMPQALSSDRLRNLLRQERDAGGLIYIKRGSEGAPHNFEIDGDRGSSGLWRNHLTTRPLQWILIYHRIGPNSGDVWVGEPDGTGGKADEYKIELKNLKGPLRVEKDFESLTGRRPPENPIYASNDR